MFIFILTYQKSIEEVESQLEAHKSYLTEHYQSGNFILSGRQVPRTGGVIFCKATSKEEAQNILEKDPFFIHQIASYQVIEVEPTGYAEGLERYL